MRFAVADGRQHSKVAGARHLLKLTRHLRQELARLGITTLLVRFRIQIVGDTPDHLAELGGIVVL